MRLGPIQSWLRSRHAAVVVAVAMAAQWMLHRADAAIPFPPYSLGNWIVRETPGPVATEAIERLGSSAGDVLAASIVLGAIGVGLTLGRRTWAAVALVLIGSAVLIAFDPIVHSESRALAAVAAGGIAASAMAVGFAARTASATPELDAGRRALLTGGAALLFLSVAGGAALARARRFTPGGTLTYASRYRLVDDPAFVAPKGIAPRVTPSDVHYVIDINLQKPEVDPGSWRLRIFGAVQREVVYDFDHLLRTPAVEQPVLLQCISNTVGGELIGNAMWAGVPLSTLLQEAVLAEDALTIVARSADGYSDVIHRDDIGQVLIAWGMNGEVLPVKHGFPARLLFPGRYGMRSVKWLTELEVVPGQPEGYWAERGWDKDAHLLTAGRIDVPGPYFDETSPLMAGGIAWAADAVSKVEFQVDDGEWLTAELEARTGNLGWYRWRVEAPAGTGRHIVSVRAYDGSGRPQDPEPREAHPAGAQGYDRVVVEVV